jgi:hypothetical protein
MSDWLDRVIDDGGEECLNCGEWRILHGREIEDCSCGDEAYDIYECEIWNEGFL